MKRSTDRILVTHVGSLVRPVRLRELMAAKGRGEPIDEAAFETVLKDSVAEVTRLQAEVGVDIPSDGEFGKLGWTSYVATRLTGLEPYGLKPGEPAPIDPRTAGREGDKFLDFYAAYWPVQAYDWTGPNFFTSDRAMPSPMASGAFQCTAAIAYKDAEIKRDIVNFKSALRGRNFAEAFLPVAATASTPMTMPSWRRSATH
jgi:5-methyltetrahydropteroyltriglutamate--homocysteine methyltransferase